MFTPNDMFIMVYRLPEKLTDGFAFGAGRPITFTNVDWFNGYDGMTQVDLENFIRGKKYFKDGGRFLVMSNPPEFTFQLSAQ